jgi:hypothetical protein
MSVRDKEHDSGDPSLMLPSAGKLRLLGAAAGGVVLGLIAWRYPPAVGPITIAGGTVTIIDRFFGLR